MKEVSLLFDSRLFVFIRGSLLVVGESLFTVQLAPLADWFVVSFAAQTAAL